MAATHDLRVRRPTWDDLPAALAVLQAADTVLLGESDWTELGLREEWRELDLAEDVSLVELEGRLAGVASLTDRGGGRFVADGYVHPELRCSRSLATYPPGISGGWSPTSTPLPR